MKSFKRCFGKSRAKTIRTGLRSLVCNLGRVFIMALVLLILPAFISLANSATRLATIELAQSEIAPEEERVEAEALEGEQRAGEEPLEQGPIEVEPAPPEEIVIKEETREREREAGEDPLTKTQSEKVDLPERQLFRQNKLEPYGSLRMRYSKSDYVNEFKDGGSRFGLNGELQFHPKFWLHSRAEFGVNILGSARDLSDGSGKLGEPQKLNKRLLYAAVETPSTMIVFGKNWSPYYRVSSLTDRFESFGSAANGTFNADTDGASTGTGRADDVVQGAATVDFMPAELRIKPFKLNVQGQLGQPIPHAESFKYHYSFGLSSSFETEGGFNLGIAYNHAVIDDADLPVLSSIGITGDARALVLGTRVFGDVGYLATTVAFLENHESTTEGLYFDCIGWEVFGSYNLYNNWWVIGGWNILEPGKDEDLVQQYRIRYGVIGLRYSFDAFRHMLYAEIKLDDSRSVAGERPGNVYTVGIRWDLP